MRKLSVCLFYGLCVFTIVFSLFWMALPKLPLSQSLAGSETDPASPLSLAAQAAPQTDAARYCLRDSGGRVAVYTCRADGTPGTLAAARCAAAYCIYRIQASISSSGTRYSLRHCSYSSI